MVCIIERTAMEPEVARPAIRRSRFWHYIKSRWWILALLALGWVPLFIIGFLGNAFPNPKNPNYWNGWGMAWGMAASIPLTVLALVLGVLHLVTAVVADFRKAS